MIFSYFGQKSHRNRVEGNTTVKNLMRFRITFKRPLVDSHLKFCANHTKKGNSFLLVRSVSQVPTASLAREGLAKSKSGSTHTSFPPRDGLLGGSHHSGEGNQIQPPLNSELVGSEERHTSSFLCVMPQPQAKVCDLLKFQSPRKWPHLIPASANQQLDQGRSDNVRSTDRGPPLSSR